jgi:hypothetical protein
LRIRRFTAPALRPNACATETPSRLTAALLEAVISLTKGRTTVVGRHSTCEDGRDSTSRQAFAISPEIYEEPYLVPRNKFGHDLHSWSVRLRLITGPPLQSVTQRLAGYCASRH